ncbi:MAG TPA: N-acetylmuramic acid 6-phosphate etherase [Roseibacterium sp.]|nr:N-acetylmuramic acid 6-phosphate etherase [Roseibacterium sp.]
MHHRQTEHLHEAAIGLDALPLSGVALILAAAQRDALSVMPDAAEVMASGGARMADVIKGGGCLHYAAAGSSGLMAMADACELAGTFGIDPAQIRIHMAGGVPHDATMPGNTEDDSGAAGQVANTICARDAVILISASGSTPYVLEIARHARAAGAATICISNTADAPLLVGADVAVCLPTPPEVLAGSTRMGAGTAQKVALNIMSTVMGVALGHVHNGMMVNVRADNAKLRARAVGIVSAIANVDEGDATRCLGIAGGGVKAAILLASGASDLNEATARLARSDGHIRAALAEMKRRT